MTKAHILLAIVLLASSCSTTNMLFMDSAIPLDKNRGETKGGIGVGFGLAADSLKQNGQYAFSDELAYAPVLSVQGAMGAGYGLNVKGGIYFPGIVSGFGFQAGIQKSLLSEDYDLNLAVGLEGGFCVPLDFLGSDNADTSSSGDLVNYAGFGNVYIPLTYAISDQLSLTVSGRIGFNSHRVRLYKDLDEFGWFHFHPKVLTVGLRYNHYLLEFSQMTMGPHSYPAIGLGYIEF